MVASFADCGKFRFFCLRLSGGTKETNFPEIFALIVCGAAV